MVSGAKHIIYRFMDDPRDDELEDAKGLSNFRIGDIITRQQKTWRINNLKMEFEINNPEQPSVMWVYLIKVVVH